MAENSPLTIIRKMARAKPAERIKLRKKLIDGMMPALRKWFESVEDRITDMVQRGLLFYWKIGSEANDVRSDHKKYGEHAIESCVAALQEDKSVLYKAVRFFKAYDGDELKHLLSLRIQGTGRPILWSHVIVLITVENKAKREVYTQKL